jgi:hypothetical protein
VAVRLNTLLLQVAAAVALPAAVAVVLVVIGVLLQGNPLAAVHLLSLNLLLLFSLIP